MGAVPDSEDEDKAGSPAHDVSPKLPPVPPAAEGDHRCAARPHAGREIQAMTPTERIVQLNRQPYETVDSLIDILHPATDIHLEEHVEAQITGTPKLMANRRWLSSTWWDKGTLCLSQVLGWREQSVAKNRVAQSNTSA